MMIIIREVRIKHIYIYNKMRKIYNTYICVYIFNNEDYYSR